MAVLMVVRADEHAAYVRDHPPDPLPDEQAVARVIGPAVDVVAAGGLRDPAGAYSFQSCRNAADPPYRVVLNMTFAVPQGNPPAYLNGVAAAMSELGWVDAATPAPHFGHKLVHDGLTATFYRNGERTDLATMTVDGECRVVGEHGRDDPAWTDVTGRLRPQR